MSLLDDARRLAGQIPIIPYGTHAEGTCVFCRHDSTKGPPDEAHLPGCPWLSFPQIVAALETADDLAGLLLMVLDDQIRNGWVAEDSPLLDEPRKVLERWHNLKVVPQETEKDTILTGPPS